MSARGCFVVLDGIEGAGKTTQLAALVERSAEFGAGDPLPLLTREPGGTPLGESLRALLLDSQREGMDPIAELLLIFAARAEHIDKLIRPNLETGRWVFCDRFTDASFAYQGAGRGMGEERIEMLERVVQGSFRPDLVVILDLEPQEGMARARRRERAADRFEREPLEFFRAVRKGYLARAHADPDRYLVIDATAPEEEITSQVIEGIRERSSAWGLR
ncbi:dTMP kinase [Thioalkalivibrio sp. HK1]|uniref:dTMP kinase n=1 Tax=Thioalkalivibrio sp. HK1 TaxID=1469245 RepID=UPI00047105B7|nr:dTMP kinase [Thioalkalivibrio sp. HK1]